MAVVHCPLQTYGEALQSHAQQPVTGCWDKCWEHHKHNSLHLHFIEVKADISELLFNFRLSSGWHMQLKVYRDFIKRAPKISPSHSDIWHLPTHSYRSLVYLCLRMRVRLLMQAVSVLGYNTAQIRLAHAGEFSWVMFYVFLYKAHTLSTYEVRHTNIMPKKMAIDT